MVTKGKRGREGGINLEFGINRDRQWINSKVLWYSTWNHTQYPVINHNGKESEKECIYMYN